jgi:hypothetical protein
VPWGTYDFCPLSSNTYDFCPLSRWSTERIQGVDVAERGSERERGSRRRTVPELQSETRKLIPAEMSTPWLADTGAVTPGMCETVSERASTEGSGTP